MNALILLNLLNLWIAYMVLLGVENANLNIVGLGSRLRLRHIDRVGLLTRFHSGHATGHRSHPSSRFALVSGMGDHPRLGDVL